MLSHRVLGASDFRTSGLVASVLAALGLRGRIPTIEERGHNRCVIRTRLNCLVVTKLSSFLTGVWPPCF